MKKKLEAELISIAHRVLKIHNREEIAQLQQEALNLYQKLSILRFYEEHFEPAKPTISKADLEFAIETIPVDSPNLVIEPLAETTSVNFIPTTEGFSTDIIEPVTDEIVDEPNVEITETENMEQIPVQEVTTFIEKTIHEVDSDDSDIPVIEEKELEETTIVAIESETEKIVPTLIEEEPVIEETLITEVIEEPINDTVIEQETTVLINENVDFEVSNQGANPLFNEEQPTLVDQFKPQQTENNLFSDNLFAEIDEDFAPKADNSIQTSFENIFGQSYKDLEFVKADQLDTEDEKPKIKRESKKTKQSYETESVDLFGAKTVSDLYTNTITLGLNDRIAFQVHLFNNSDQDLNRVVSQLNTMNNIDEALDFITNMVKPDYNNWKHKEEYEERFMALVEKRFS